MTEPGPHRHERAKGHGDPEEWHGHRIVTEDDLDRTFDDRFDEERPAVYRRRILHGVVLVLLIAAIIAAILVALAIFRGDIRLGAGPAPTTTTVAACPAGQFRYPDVRTVKVNVYNSTRHTGLASEAAGLLKGRGFVVGAVGNKPVSASGLTAVVVSGPKGFAHALGVQRNIPDTEYVQDQRTDASVDVIVGAGFAALTDPAKVSTKPGRLSCPRFSPPPGTPVPGSTARK